MYSPACWPARRGSRWRARHCPGHPDGFRPRGAGCLLVTAGGEVAAAGSARAAAHRAWLAARTLPIFPNGPS
jgi:hypothetical protein